MAIPNENGSQDYCRHTFEVRISGPRFNVSLSLPMMIADEPIMMQPAHGQVIDVPKAEHAHTALVGGNNAAYQRQSSPQDYGVRNGGGNKPASEKQINLMKRLATERGMNLEEIIQKKYGKPLAAVLGVEANNIIQDFKGGRL